MKEGIESVVLEQYKTENWGESILKKKLQLFLYHQGSQAGTKSIVFSTITPQKLKTFRLLPSWKNLGL